MAHDSDSDFVTQIGNICHLCEEEEEELNENTEMANQEKQGQKADVGVGEVKMFEEWEGGGEGEHSGVADSGTARETQPHKQRTRLRQRRGQRWRHTHARH